MSHAIRWTLPKIRQRLQLVEPLVYRRRSVLPPFRYYELSGPDEPPPVGPDVDDQSWNVVEPLTHWGRAGDDFVMRVHFSIPSDWPVDAACGLFLPLGEPEDFSHPEALIYVDGIPYAACDRHHQEVALRAEWRDGATHVLALHGWTGLGDTRLRELLRQMNNPSLAEEASAPIPLLHFVMRQCQIVQIDQPTRDFVALARVLLGALKVMSEDVPARGKLLYALDQAFRLLDTREPFGDDFYASVAPAYERLRAGIAGSGAPLDVAVSATGHAHIDVAWLWTPGQTRRKAGRTFYTVQHLMDQFPEYHFTQSQPQLYDFVRQDYPDLFADIKSRVAEGRWEIIGGMWVEADCNITGAESLARQFLLGRTFFETHFGAGVETPVLWLPDVFGYSWALPQLIKQAGLDYFFTIKIGWNQYNRLPYDSFWWQGIDGTRVLTHFSTSPEGNGIVSTNGNNRGIASTYNASANAEQLMGTWTNFQQKDLGRGDTLPPLLMAYGFGDGGGGPTREMIENIRIMSDIPALPRIHQQNVGAFFRNLDETVGDILPVWNGELYLELHRGTYTTQGRNKRANRLSEFLLHDAEYLSMQALLLSSSYRYPVEELRHAWELVCLNQFHDIIPGSSITPVYQESQRQYIQIHKIAREASARALAHIAQMLEGDLLITNPTSFERSDQAFWSGYLPAHTHLIDAATGDTVLVQASEQGTWIATASLPPYSITALTITSDAIPVQPSDLVATPTLLENKYIRVELNADGDITRIFDKIEDREVLAAGGLANQFQAFEDRPKAWDAWDVDIFYDDKMWLSDPALAVRVVEAGPLRVSLLIERQILHSRYTQRISLSYNSPGIDIQTSIDWRERHILLKVAFPVDVLSPVATYEIQWGNVQRPTHRNTSWDWARFETCAQKWVDLSEGGYGVSLLNNGKYGHDIRDNVIRISLLRSSTSPDPEADQGNHTFTYSIFPHSGGWDERTVGAAYSLNDPLIVHASDTAISSTTQGSSVYVSLVSLIASEQKNIVIETIKRAEDGDGLIVRCYESQRCRGHITLKISFPLQAAWQTNLLEQNQRELEITGQEVRFNVHPYEIVTLRLLPV